MKKILFLLCVIFLSCASRDEALLRIGYSPNVTHAQALLGFSEARFEAFFPNNHVKGQIFHAGPSIVEALFAKEVDVAYVGPVPAINSYIRSGGDFVILAGAAQGGEGLVVLQKANIKKMEDLIGKRVLTPQLGNTQDVTARATFQDKGWQVSLFPVANTEHINLFKKQDVEASWTVEPWVSRLVHEAGGSLLFENNNLTTVLVARKSWVENNPEPVKQLLKAHVAFTLFLQTNKDESKVILNKKIEEIIGKAIPEESMQDSFNRIRFDWKISKELIQQNAKNLQNVNFLPPNAGGIEGLLYLEPLQEVLNQT